jgi:hypothetical protein
LKDLAAIMKNRIEPAGQTGPSFEVTTLPARAQRRVLELLKVKL